MKSTITTLNNGIITIAEYRVPEPKNMSGYLIRGIISFAQGQFYVYDWDISTDKAVLMTESFNIAKKYFKDKIANLT